MIPEVTWTHSELLNGIIMWALYGVAFVGFCLLCALGEKEWLPKWLRYTLMAVALVAFMATFQPCAPDPHIVPPNP